MSSVESYPPSESAEIANPLDSADHVIDPRLLALDEENRQSSVANRPSKSRKSRTQRKRNPDPLYYGFDKPQAWERELVKQQIGFEGKDKIYTKAAAESLRPLLNAAIEEASGIDLLDIPSPDNLVLQLGASRWTQQEFEVFLRTLARKGKNATKDIATAIESKSEVETQSLLFHLRAASQQRQQYISSKVLDYTTQVPAATEISNECCKALEFPATALAWACEKQDVLREVTHHGDNWLLDNKVAAKLERAYNREESDHPNNPDPDSEGGEGSGSLVNKDPGEKSGEAYGSDVDSEPSVHGSEAVGGIQTDDGTQQSKEDEENERAALEYWPAARLFIAPNWISLMDDLFMRQVPPDGPYEVGEAPDWRVLALKGQVPSIYHSAFSDFYNLVVNITRRLVQAALNQTRSRLRASDKLTGKSLKPTTNAPKITVPDVEAARDLLGMPQDRYEIFTGIARKCRLRMQLAKNTDIDQFTVERLLLPNIYYRPYEAARNMAAAAEPFDGSLEDWDNASVGDSSNEDEEEVLTASEGPANETMSRKRKRARFEDPVEPYLKFDRLAEAYDQVQDAQEELRLWQVLGRDPPLEITKRAAPVKGSRRELRPTLPKNYPEEDDWENYTDYRAEWETYGDHHLPHSAFWAMEMRKDTRRAKRAKRKQEVLEARAARNHQDVERRDQPSDHEPSVRGAEEIEEQIADGSRADEEQTADGFQVDEEQTANGFQEYEEHEERTADMYQEDEEIYENGEAPLSFANEGLYTGLDDDPSGMFGAQMMFDDQGDIGEDFAEGI
ncbi:MAG: hypothetical protein Q9165_002470 [Trypethelium subeluteriae]